MFLSSQSSSTAFASALIWPLFRVSALRSLITRGSLKSASSMACASFTVAASAAQVRGQISYARVFVYIS